MTDERMRLVILHEILALYIPSGKRLHNYGKSPFLMGQSTISMAIFNSYVSLPGGKMRSLTSDALNRKES